MAVSGENLTNSSLVTPTMPSDLAEPDDVQSYLRLGQTLSIVGLSFTIWIAGGMIAYGRKKNKWRCHKKGERIYIASFLPVPFAILRFLVDQIRLYETVIPGATDRCELVADISDILFGISLYSVYFSLWLRQKGIYAHPIMEPIDRRVVYTLSWGLLLIVTTTSFALTCAFVIPAAQVVKNARCVQERINSTAFDNVKIYVLGGFTAFWQMGLLALFIYPLIRNRTKIERNPARRSSSSSKRQVRSRADRVMEATRRSVLFAVTAVFSDFVTVVIGMMVIPKTYPSIIRHSLYDFNLFVNIFCVMSTFGKNGKILLPCCRLQKSAKTWQLNNLSRSRSSSSNGEAL